MKTPAEAKYELTPQGQLGASGGMRLMHVETAFKELVSTIFEMVPATEHRDQALHKILVAKLLCSQAISHPGLTAQTPAAVNPAPTTKEVQDAPEVQKPQVQAEKEPTLQELRRAEKAKAASKKAGH